MNNIKYIRNLKISYTTIDDEAVLLDMNQGKYYAMNNIGVAIWNLFENPLSISEIYLKLEEIYNEDKNIIQNDANDFIQALIKKELIIRNG